MTAEVQRNTAGQVLLELQNMASSLRREESIDQVALRTFVEDNYASLVQFAGFVGMESAEDLVQSALVDLTRSFGRVADPLRWVRRAIATKKIDAIRAIQTERSTIERIGDQLPRAEAVDQPNIWEDHEWVSNLLARLPPTQRAVLALVVDSYQTHEIALLLGKTREAVRKNLQLARQRAAALIENHQTTPREASK
jgi:RNA polymerase sigma factor (sigma-70 family)